MSISRNRIAKIPAQQYPALAVMADAVKEAFVNKELADTAVTVLVAMVKSYFIVPTLTAEDLLTLLGHQKYFNTPGHAQRILGDAFADYLYQRSFEITAPQESFESIAQLMGLKVNFYAEEKSEEEKENLPIKLLPDATINEEEDLALNVMVVADYGKRHYDRIMATAELAAMHESYSTAPLGFYRQLAPDNKLMQSQIRQALEEINRVREHKKESASRAHATVTPYGSTSRTPKNTTKAISLSLTQEAEHKAVNSEEKLSWEESITRQIQSKPTVIQEVETFTTQQLAEKKIAGLNDTNAATRKVIYNLDADKVAVVDVATKERWDRELHAERDNRKVIYSLWGNKVAIVDSDTQEKWDRELAERLSQEEAPPCRNR